ncbi:MAG: IMP cyclohydrolase [Candidatus Aminicenantales bacterium]
MKSPWDNLTRMIYPGRLLALGRDRADEHHIVLYAITGRSPSSQARRLAEENGAVWTKPTDPEALKKGNPELLVYPAMVFSRGIAVSNGRQTSDIDSAAAAGAVPALDAGLRRWSYEPDAPIHTPRISGCIGPAGSAAMSVLKRGPDGELLRSFHEVSLGPGRGRFVSTYAGDNREPLAAFSGDPLELEFNEDSPQATAEAAYAALRPDGRSGDYRVAVACVFALRADMSRRRLAIINRYERTAP